MKICRVLLLVFILLSVAQANTYPVSYQILENHNKEVCDGRAKYVIEIGFENPTDKDARLLVLSYVLVGDKAYTPCEPESWRDVVILPSNSFQTCRYYYENLPESGNIFVKVEFGRKKEYTTLQYTLATPTTTTHTIWSPRNIGFFEKLNSTLYQIYSQLNLNKILSYKYALYTILFIPLFMLLILLISRYRKKRKYSISVEGVEVSPHVPFRLYAKCHACGRLEFFPFQCNYCGKFFCGDHYLPFKHDCDGLDEWKKKGPLPPGVVWEYKDGKTYYRKY